jgi:hypothetical protein
MPQLFWVNFPNAVLDAPAMIVAGLTVMLSTGAFAGLGHPPVGAA